MSSLTAGMLMTKGARDGLNNARHVHACRLTARSFLVPGVISALAESFGSDGAAIFRPFQAAAPHCRRTHAWPSINLPRTIHKLDNANKVVSCAVFFLSPR